MINMDTNVIINSNHPLTPEPIVISRESIFELDIKQHHFSYENMKSRVSKHSKNFLKFALHNARSLCSNVDNYRLLFENSGLDMLGLVETWLKSSVSNKSVELSGYVLVRSDRKLVNRNRGGGVAFYLKKNLRYSILAKSEANSEIDYLFLKLPKANLVCGIVYKPPDVSVCKLRTVFEIIAELVATEPNVLLMGDFNVNILDSNSSKCRFMVDQLNTLSFKIVNSSPTRHLPGCTPSLIDLIMGNCTQNVNNVYQSSVGGISDHDLICIDYKFKNAKTPPENYWYRDYDKINVDCFLRDLLECNLTAIYSFSNVNEKLDYFNNILLSLINRHAPLTRKFIRDPSSPWINGHVHRMFNNRANAYECWRRDKNNPQKWNNFVKLRNITNRTVKNTKREYFASQLNAFLPAKKLWTNIKRLGLKHSNTKVGGGDVTATSLNRFFVSHYVPSSFLENVHADEVPAGFSFRGVTSNEILEVFAAASCDSIGTDLIPLSILKKSLSVTLPYITDIFNFCITTSEFPNSWKMAKIIPIGKIDNPVTEKDYRPISILCALSKILESILSKQLNEYLNNHNLLCSLQSGYRKNCSTITALIKIEDDIRSSLDKRMVTVMALLDFSKAFDSIDHWKLCNKLVNLFNFDRASVNLIKAYLSGRSQYVDFNNTVSENVQVLSGVPQGSILGPLLFSMYINDMPTVLTNCTFHLYADDCQLYISGNLNKISEMVSLINRDIENVLKWCQTNGLILNTKKTQTIIFRSKRADVSDAPLVKVGSDNITYSNTIKNLGIVMDCNFNWNAQVNAVCSKVYRALHSLVVLRHSTPQHIRLQLAKSLIIPLFLYGDVLFSLSSQSNTRKLNLVFNAVTRYVYNLRKYDHISNYSNLILGCNFTNYMKLRICTQAFKILNESPAYLQNFFNYSRSSRSNVLIIPRCFSNFLSNSFRYRSIREWNNLPRECKAARTFSKFKHLCSYYFK